MAAGVYRHPVVRRHQLGPRCPDHGGRVPLGTFPSNMGPETATSPAATGSPTRARTRTAEWLRRHSIGPPPRPPSASPRRIRWWPTALVGLFAVPVDADSQQAGPQVQGRCWCSQVSPSIPPRIACTRREGTYPEGGRVKNTPEGAIRRWIASASDNVLLAGDANRWSIS
jgi:hypothetical protein